MVRRRRTQKAGAILNTFKDLIGAAPSPTQTGQIPVLNSAREPSKLNNVEELADEPNSAFGTPSEAFRTPIEAFPTPSENTPGSNEDNNTGTAIVHNNFNSIEFKENALPGVSSPVKPISIEERDTIVSNFINDFLYNRDFGIVEEIYVPISSIGNVPLGREKKYRFLNSHYGINSKSKDIIKFFGTSRKITVPILLDILSQNTNQYTDRFLLPNIPHSGQIYNDVNPLGSKIAKGSSGTIYRHTMNPRRVFKVVSLKYDINDKKAIGKWYNNNVLETFMQYYLSIITDAVPKIYSHSYEFNFKDNITSYIIEMENLEYPWMNLNTYFNRLLERSSTAITFVRFSEILIIICIILITLEDITSFVHRDFKLDNIMINSKTGHIKIIDFGHATIRLPNDNGKDIIINRHGRLYHPDAPARFQQDLGMFLIFFRQFYINRGDITDIKLHKFIEDLIPDSIKGLSGYKYAYNSNGSKFANPNTEFLTPRTVLHYINAFVEDMQKKGLIRGGSGRRRTRRSRRSRRRSHKK